MLYLLLKTEEYIVFLINFNKNLTKFPIFFIFILTKIC